MIGPNEYRKAQIAHFRQQDALRLALLEARCAEHRAKEALHHREAVKAEREMHQLRANLYNFDLLLESDRIAA